MVRSSWAAMRKGDVFCVLKTMQGEDDERLIVESEGMVTASGVGAAAGGERASRWRWSRKLVSRIYFFPVMSAL